jgi:hypothetical protein
MRSLRVFPNPVTAQTVIRYDLARSASVSCVVYDAAGSLVSRLAVGAETAGEHQLAWDASGVKPGIYFCKLVADGTTTTARLVRVR